MAEKPTSSFLSVCSGIEAASVAWNPLGWKAIGFSEIERFPSAVLAHHYPDIPNYGDLTQFASWSDDIRPNLVVGGTPCQSFSVAGLRKGLDDPRGNLTLVFLGLLERTRPRWVVWENVPGVLSDKTGAFGAFLGGLGQLGYGFAYRVLDAQYFGVPQRRRRVFVVGYLGDWRPPAAVLFEPESLRGDSPPSRETGEGVASGVAGSLGGSSREGGWPGTDLDGHGAYIPEKTHSLREEGFDASEDGTGRGTPLVSQGFRMVAFGEYANDDAASTLKQRDYKDATDLIAFSCKDHGSDAGEMAPTLRSMNHDSSHANGGGQVAVAFAENSRSEIRLEGGDGNQTGALSTGGGKPGQGAPTIAFHNRQDPGSSRKVTHALGSQDNGLGLLHSMRVRRLTPVECERLQGFPDNYSRIEWRGKPADQCPDGPRYKALGNSMAVPVMRWIGERIQAVDNHISQSNT